MHGFEHLIIYIHDIARRNVRKSMEKGHTLEEKVEVPKHAHEGVFTVSFLQQFDIFSRTL